VEEDMKQISGNIKVGGYPAVAVPSRRQGDQARYGVGELIHLTVTQQLPPGGPYYWAVKSGGGHIANKAQGAADYTAPDLTPVQVQQALTEIPVQLCLKNAANQEVAVLALTVVRPTMAGLMKLGGRHLTGSAGSGFWGQPILTPNDVSFMNVSFRENKGVVKVTGSGFDPNLAGQNHAVGIWLTGSKVVAQGTLMQGADNVYTPGLAPPGGWHNGNTLQVGTLVWDIAWEYKLTTDPAPSGLQFCKGFHNSVCSADGQIRTDKGGAYHIAHLADPTVGAPVPPAGACPYALL
jgi:hypothetical protein